MLPYERVDDSERLAGTGSAEHERPSERIDDVDPSLVHLLLEVEQHRDIDRVLVLDKLARLFERLVLEIEPVRAHIIFYNILYK